MGGQASLPGRIGRRALGSCLMPGAIAAVLCMGGFDLALTLHFMLTSGMIEVNPLARYVVDGGPGVLATFKVSLMTLNAGLLWIARGRPLAKVGAWASVAVMVRLSAHWLEYVGFVAGDAPGLADGLEIAMLDPRWVRF